MGTILLHAGMPKAGSSSVQRWLATNERELAEDGVQLVVVNRRGADHVRPTRHDGKGIVSGAFLYAYLGFGRPKETVERFVEGVHDLTGPETTSIVTAEGFANLLARPDEQFVGGLERLAASHRVVIAYYVRPQHTSLEAAWRQWGYREDTPVRYLTEWAETLDYLGTLEAITEAAPRVELRVRPFRRDLLEGGDVVVDFARTFLGREPAGPLPQENPGLPLDLVAVLRQAPEGRYWDSSHDNRTLNRIRVALEGVAVEPSVESERARAILQAFAHDRFEAGNRRLIERLGWPTDHYVPAIELDERTLEPLDDLLGRPSPAATQALFLGALDALLDGVPEVDARMAAPAPPPVDPPPKA